jgi:bifunctional DNA-binding transcriptional regulator/antitoxin component of YhaV-PrlF toxin-antitoxin module
MTAKVSDKMQVALPLDVCAELGIKPGVELDFRASGGQLVAVKVPPIRLLSDVYTEERNAEELTIQKGCSTEVPEDFPR